jgi:galactonate dehydratase
VGPSRRTILASSLVLAPTRIEAKPNVRVTGFELLPIRATERTVWLLVRLSTDAGLTGLGEASDAFGFANTSKQDALRMESELRAFFELIKGRSPLNVEAYRQAGESMAKSGGLVSATAYSAMEQALWDLAAKSLDIPAHALFGGAVRDTLPVYANINRATRARTPAGFAATARKAVADGFRALKAAPFDGFPKPGASAGEIDSAVDQGIACMAAIRDAVGSSVELMVDCHSFFDVPLARSVAQRLEPYNLGWYEEPIAPEKTDETLEIRKSIRQQMAGGEILFGIHGFAPLCRRRAVDVIMRDVKHCGGLLEMTRIAAVANADEVAVAPHNPSGPVSTAATVHICAGMKNFRILELQWGEVPWRSDLVIPPEKFEQGSIHVPQKPGFGIQLNDKQIKAHLLA